MTLPDIEIRGVDDWTAVYKDGKKVWENHSCPLVEGLLALDIEFTYEYFDTDEYDEVTIEDSDGNYLFPEELPT